MIITHKEYIFQEKPDLRFARFAGVLLSCFSIFMILAILWNANFALIYFTFVLSLVILKKTEWGVLLLAFSLPLFGMESGKNHFSFFPDIIILILLLKWFAGMIFQDAIRLKKTPVDLWLFIFMFFSIISIFSANQHLLFEIKRIKNPFLIISEAFSSSPEKWIYPLQSASEILIYWLFYFFLVNFINGLDLVKKITYSLLAGLFIAVAAGFIQYAGMIIWPKTFLCASPDIHMHKRMHGLFERPNHFAQYIVLVSPFYFSMLFFSVFKKKLAHIIPALILTVAVVLTMQRGSWIIFSLTTAYLFVLKSHQINTWFQNKRVRDVLMYLWVILFTGIFSVMLLLKAEKSPLPAKMADTFMYKDRTDTWIAASELYMQNPIYGIGVGNFRSRFNDTFYGNHPYAKIYNKTALSTYLQILAESGPAALIAFIAMLALYFNLSITNFLSADDRDPNKKYIVAISAVLFGLFFYSIFQSIFYLKINLIYITIIIGMLFFLIREKIPHIYFFKEKWRGHLFSLIILAALLFRFFIV